jgi:hypothetical protein
MSSNDESSQPRGWVNRRNRRTEEEGRPRRVRCVEAGAANRAAEEIATLNFAAHRATDPKSRATLYAAKTARIALAITDLPREAIYLNYQIKDGVLYVVTTLIGANRPKVFHTPWRRFPGLVQLAVVEALGNPYVFLSNQGCNPRSP